MMILNKKLGARPARGAGTINMKAHLVKRRARAALTTEKVIIHRAIEVLLICVKKLKRINCVNSPRLEETAQFRARSRYWPGSKPAPLNSKPSTS